MPDGSYWNPAVETMAVPDLREVQATKPQRQLRRVPDRSPFYRCKFG